MNRLKWQQMGLVFVVVFALCMTLTTSVVADQTVKNPDRIVEAGTSGSECLDPAYNCCTEALQLTRAMYDPLLHEGPSGEIIPWLATKVPSKENGLIKNGGKTYILPIRKNVKFHNGDVLTPEDVEYSFERMMALDVSGGFGFVYLNPLVGKTSTRDENGNFQVTFEEIDNSVEVEGNSVVFHLARPLPWFLRILTDPAFTVDKSWTINQGGWPGTAETWKEYNRPDLKDLPMSDQENGTGPFKLANWEPEESIQLVRYNDYWHGPAKVKRVVRKIVPEWSTRLMMLKTGDADIITTPREYLVQVKGLQGVSVETGIPQAGISAIYFNQEISPKSKFIGSGKLDGEGVPPDFFSNVTVRKAFSYAFNWQTLIQDVFKGRVLKAKGPIPKGLPYYNPDQKTYHNDPEKAKELFKEAYNGKLWEVGFKLTAIVYQNSDKRIIDILRYNLKQINPKFDIKTAMEPWSALWSHQVRGWLPLFVSGWGADYPDPHNLIFNFMYSLGPDASTQGFDKYDKLVESGISTRDPDERKEIYYKLQKLAYQDAVNIWLYQGTTNFVSRTWLHGDWKYPHWSPGAAYYYNLWKE